MGKRKIRERKQTEKIKGKKLKESALVAQDTGTDHMNPVFSFLHTCNNHFQLSDWQPNEIRDLISTFKIMESLCWADVPKHIGLRYKAVDPRTFTKELPETISPDVTICEFRVSKRARVFGYRMHNVFYLIWFDRNHDVYPMS